MSQSTEIKVPDIGGFKDVAVIEILVNVGDTLAKDAALITVESDKAAMDIPCSHAGVVEKLLVKVGDKISEGMPILLLNAVGETVTQVSTPAMVTTPDAAEIGVTLDQNDLQTEIRSTESCGIAAGAGAEDNNLGMQIGNRQGACGTDRNSDWRGGGRCRGYCRN
jgi:pyruvate/2-oxoglutarate dehydrogenase complex dihydrolipoamide acyltransferase (E2) component